MILKHVKKTGLLSREFVYYAVIGLSGVVLDFVLFVLLTRVFGIDPLLSNFISISAGIINNFLLNVRFTFKVTDHLWHRFALFYGVGFLGIVLSEILLSGFHYGLGLSDVVAKLATLPVILVFQFVLNKFISFGDVDKNLSQLRRLVRHWPFFLIILVYSIASLVFIMNIPAKNQAANALSGPDEVTHYVYNVNIILKEKRLPVSGKDDIGAYRSCRDNLTGEVPCLYSYEFYPGPNYIVAAFFAGTLHKAVHVSPEVGARAAPLLFGLIFVTCTYAIGYLIMRRRLYATVLTAGVVLIPQVVFTNSYVNLDAHSLAISAILGLALTKLFLTRQIRWLYITGFLVFGLLPLAKYNYFVLFVPIIVLLYAYIVRARLSWPTILRFLAWSALGFLLLSAFWYIRNLVLYHDLLGQNFALQKMQEFHALGQGKSLNIHSMSILAQMNFFELLFNSFFYGLGAMFLFLKDGAYTIILAGLVAVMAVFFYTQTHPMRRPRANVKQLWLVAGLWFIILGMSIGLVILNSLKYDFQPQGRYVYPVIIPAVMALAYSIRSDRRNAALAHILAGVTLFIILNGAQSFLAFYI
jgi:putative flippase GtrA